MKKPFRISIHFFMPFISPPPCSLAGRDRHAWKKTVRLSLLIWLTALPMAWASHPLITDDTGTQGRGKFQIELDNQISFNKEKLPNGDGTSTISKSTEAEMKMLATYGVVDTVDLILGVPYQWKRNETDGAETQKADGLADISLEVKWRFFEKDGYSLAVKPGVTLSVGDEGKGLGTGRVALTFFFIATKDWDPWAFHLNLGYKRNENKLDQREDIWHTSVAGEWKLRKDLKLVANIGMEKNPDRTSSIDPAFILGGIVYSVTDNFDIDLGIKGGLTPAEPDCTLLGGLTFRF